ncbi:MAG: NADH-quinone oxidoreductase subunit J [Anaerolineales bacterium]
MTFEQFLFILIAAGTLGAALLVVTTRNLIHAALWLIATLFGVAILFVFLNAGFLGVVQVVIYIGAIAILMIFAIMLTRQVADTKGPRFNENWLWALFISLVFFAAIAYILSLLPEFEGTKPILSSEIDPIKQLGVALVSPDSYLLAFELASVLLLAALIGAVIIAWEQR